MLSSILAQVIEWFVSKFIVREVESVVDDLKAKEVSKQDAKALTDAATIEAQQKALDSTIRNTFGG